jgi:hypothetical protein
MPTETVTTWGSFAVEKNIWEQWNNKTAPRKRKIEVQFLRRMSTNQGNCHHSAVVSSCNASRVILKHYAFRGLSVQLSKREDIQTCGQYILCTVLQQQTSRYRAEACLHSS